MSSATLTVHFAYADATAKSYVVGPFDVSDDAVSYFKDRLRKYNAVDTESGKKITNLTGFLCSENGAAMTGIKSASITVSQSRRIYDAATYGG